MQSISEHVTPHTPVLAGAASGALQLLRLTTAALGSERFYEAVTDALSGMARGLNVRRVSVGFVVRDRIRLGAISDTPDFSSRQPVARLLGAAMEETLTQGGVLSWPSPDAALDTAAHESLARANERAAVESIPFLLGDRIVGVLLLESDTPLTPAQSSLLRDLALFVAPVLALRWRLDAPVAGRWAEALQPSGRALDQPRRGPRRRVLLGATVALTALGLIEGATQRTIAAPIDGFIATVEVKPGTKVAQGALLFAFDDRDLRLEAEKWRGELAQLDKAYREAMANDSAAKIEVARHKFEQAQAALDLVQLQSQRTRVVAPYDGLILSGDLSQLVGAPVKRGQELAVFASEQSFRVVARVAEAAIDEIRPGQHGRVLFAGAATSPLEVRVVRVAPVATVFEGANVFEIEAELVAGAPAAVRAGVSGVARIDVERRAVGAVLWQDASRWLGALWWRLIG
ncbi:MAG: HlyD family efflux transporter periplasmic adaptor subunit [Burkholderiaceae bacterium]